MPRTSRFIPLLLLAAVLVTFGRIATHEFTWWDDHGTIHHNPRLNPPTVQSILYYWTHPQYGLYIPVTYTVWGVLAAIAQVDEPDPFGITLNPWIFHAASILLHTLGVLVVYQILKMLSKTQWPACLGALLFGLHPVQVEPVAWASGMKDLLCGLLSLLALWQYLLFAASSATDAGQTRQRRRHYAAGTVALILAMLSKPTAVVTPLIGLVLDVWILKRPWRQALRSLAPWFVLIAPCLIWTKLVQPATGVPLTPLWTRPLIAADAVAFYLYKLMFPLKLGIDYGRRPPLVLEQGWLYFTWLVPAALAICLWLGRKRFASLVAAALVFVIGLAPVLGFVPFLFQYYSTVADHYLYLPMLGPGLAATWLTANYGGRIITGLCVGVLVLFAIGSAAQARHWRDEVALSQHAIRVNPFSFAGHRNLGSALVRRQEFEQAETHLRAAVRLRPNHAPARDDLAKLLIAQGKLEEAVQQIGEVIRLKSELPSEESGDIAQAEKMLDEVRAALRARGQLTPATAPSTNATQP